MVHYTLHQIQNQVRERVITCVRIHFFVQQGVCIVACLFLFVQFIKYFIKLGFTSNHAKPLWTQPQCVPFDLRKVLLKKFLIPYILIPANKTGNTLNRLKL